MAIDIADTEDTVREIESSGGVAKGFPADVSVEEDILKIAMVLTRYGLLEMLPRGGTLLISDWTYPIII